MLTCGGLWWLSFSLIFFFVSVNLCTLLSFHLLFAVCILFSHWWRVKGVVCPSIYPCPPWSGSAIFLSAIRIFYLNFVILGEKVVGSFFQTCHSLVTCVTKERYIWLTISVGRNCFVVSQISNVNIHVQKHHHGSDVTIRAAALYQLHLPFFLLLVWLAANTTLEKHCILCF